jgi:hypothetical protein
LKTKKILCPRNEALKLKAQQQASFLFELDALMPERNFKTTNI